MSATGTVCTNDQDSNDVQERVPDSKGPMAASAKPETLSAMITVLANAICTITRTSHSINCIPSHITLREIKQIAGVPINSLGKFCLIFITNCCQHLQYLSATYDIQ